MLVFLRNTYGIAYPIGTKRESWIAITLCSKRHHMIFCYKNHILQNFYVFPLFEMSPKFLGNICKVPKYFTCPKIPKIVYILHKIHTSN
jgi:hypothetical protein